MRRARLRRFALIFAWHFLLSVPASDAAESLVPIISPWMDHSDRAESILRRLQPGVSVIRHDVEREGGDDSLDWWPAFGSQSSVSLDAPLVIIENTPATALSRMSDATGQHLPFALRSWVSRGGHLLIIGGSPSIESYSGTKMVELMGFNPSPAFALYRKPVRRGVRGEGFSNVRIDYLHQGTLQGARVRLTAAGLPFVIENEIGDGRVTTILSGAQGQRGSDGGESKADWFASPAWEEFLTGIMNEASGHKHSLLPDRGCGSPPPAADRRDFDVRYFYVSHQPYPFSFATCEAFERASELRRLGFTSVVFAVNRSRPKDDSRALREIAAAGLQIVYYDAPRRESPESQFAGNAKLPARARSFSGSDLGWDVHDPRFRSAADHLLDGREEVRDRPLRALQLIEEFEDGGALGPSLDAPLAARGLSKKIEKNDPRWIEAEIVRADATATTFMAFRKAGKTLFPELPQSTYWPGSYWTRPHDYTYRITALADAVDEALGPGYGYSALTRGPGPASVRRTATEAWSAMRDAPSTVKHMAVYALGRPLSRSGGIPGIETWTETAWTALAHGAKGLAYWALPKGPSIAGLEALHREVARLGPWLAAADREPAPVAIVESWTTRNEGKGESTNALATCLQSVYHALELQFEDVDVAFEERLDRIPEETRALALVATPAISGDAARQLSTFVERGGHLFVESGSAIRTQPGALPIDLVASTTRSDRIHPLSKLAGCITSRVSPALAARTWRSELESIGIMPRVETTDPETEATIRGDSEIVYVFGLNHAADAREVRVRINADLGSRSWIDLRTGKRSVQSKPDELLSESLVPSGDAVVWASSRRRAERFETRVDHGTNGAASLSVVGRDARGEKLANGYPIEVAHAVGPGCREFRRRSLVLVDGGASASIRSCGPASDERIVWTVLDPLGGRSWSSLDSTTNWSGAN